jgi:hypothetical protein
MVNLYCRLVGADAARSVEREKLAVLAVVFGEPYTIVPLLMATVFGDVAVISFHCPSGVDLGEAET